LVLRTRPSNTTYPPASVWLWDGVDSIDWLLIVKLKA
jgi:hypothetical protein